MSESDAGSINDAVGMAHPPVVPRRPHPPNPRHETSGGINLSPAAKAKKPPMPPPRVKTNAGPHHEVELVPRSLSIISTVFTCLLVVIIHDDEISRMNIIIELKKWVGLSNRTTNEHGGKSSNLVHWPFYAK